MNNPDLRKASGVVGAVLVLLGVLSLVPGITTGLYGELEFAGTGSTAELFGLFQTSWLLLLAYVVIGAVGLAAMRSEHGARWFLTAAACSSSSHGSTGSSPRTGAGRTSSPLTRPTTG